MKSEMGITVCGAVTVSLPSRGRGLKFLRLLKCGDRQPVAPLAGAWVEIGSCSRYISGVIWSLPSRGRGLKLCQRRKMGG